MGQAWSWKVSKISFFGLESELCRLAAAGSTIYQIIAVQEVKPARSPFEVVVISRTEIREQTRSEASQKFQLHYSPSPDS